jgi:hypothetical protein
VCPIHADAFQPVALQYPPPGKTPESNAYCFGVWNASQAGEEYPQLAHIAPDNLCAKREQEKNAE